VLTAELRESSKANINFGRAPCDEGIIRAVADTPGCAERARPWVLAVTILG